MGERGAVEETAPTHCEDRDGDGYGLGCVNGTDCDDRDRNLTYECRSCARPEHGCPCRSDGAVQSCFLPARDLPDDKLQCSEGTRTCRSGVWSACEHVQEYVIDTPSQAQEIIVPSAGRESCDRCDPKCFKVVDDLLSEGGVGNGSVTFGPNGGLVLLPGDGGVAVDAGDAGPISQPGCAGLDACCATLSGPLRNACAATVVAGNGVRCDAEKRVYCPSDPITGPATNCTAGSGADTDCDGIPNAVDSLVGGPLSGTSNRTIFHQLDVGESGQNAIEVSFKLKNADVYFLLDTTGTMIDERDNLLSTLTTGNVVNCAQLKQCCGTNTTCQNLVSDNNQTACYNAQPMYCGRHVDCADANFDGAPDNNLKTEGVIGAVRCLVGTSWFGTGAFRELPVHKTPEPTPIMAEGDRYGDRDELLFRNSIDMTPDYERVRTALASMSMNYNWDEPEGGMLALYSLVSGKGHYFGIHRPAVPERLAAQGCGPGDKFGYPCFRRDAVPIVVFLSDAPHHNGPGNAATDSSNCNGRGAGCPYSDLTSLNSWTTAANEAATDGFAHFVSRDAEGFSTAYSVGDLRGKYFSLVGNTDGMAGDYPSSIIGCGADNNSPDTLITFTVGGNAKVPVHIKLTKNDAYDADYYGKWNPDWLPDGADDPTPATEFGAVVSLFKGIPAAVSTTINVMDSRDTTVASGPNGAYLSYIGTTNGKMSAPGFWGGVSGCAADGQTNQSAFTFRPGADARIVFDATGSTFPVNLSLHEGKPSSLPVNPAGSGIPNDNDTFETVHAVPSAGESIDGNYVERLGDSNLASVHADYTARHVLTVSGARTNGSNEIKGLTNTQALYVGLQLAGSAGWSGDPVPVAIASLNGNVATMTATWTQATDASATPIAFDDSLVGCGADPSSRETVFKFDVSSPRRVRIDTEGSSYDTVISLHDGPPVTAVTRNDVSGNGTAPGLELGELTSKAFTLSDVGTGTTALGSNYDFVQCGAAAASNDAVFEFDLARRTRIGLDVSSADWNPIVALYAATPGQATILTSTNVNDRIAPPAQDAFNVGNVLGQVSTRVDGSSLASMLDDISATTVGCGAIAGGRDQIFKFTPSGDTTVRIQATPGVAGFYPVVSVFDGPPPIGATPTITPAYDAGSVTLPDTNCQAFSYHDPSTGAAHVYTLCPTKRYGDEANTRCVNAGANSLVIVNNAAEQTFVASLVAPTTTNNGHHIGAHMPSGTVFVWRDTSPLTYSNWAAGEPNEAISSNHKCAAIQKGGRWEDKRCTSTGAASDDQTYYICEDLSPAVAPAENLVTAQTVNPQGTVESVQGSTARMYDDYNAASLMGACGGTTTAGDAVFKIVTGASGYNLTADTAGSGYGAVIGIFDTTIDAAGYKACDAAGGVPLTYALLPNKTYYILVDGTAVSAEGSYKLKLADTSVLANSGLVMACGAGSALAPSASVDVEVDANHTYYVVTDTATGTVGAYTLQLNALYQARTTVSNASTLNERGVSAFALPDPYRSKISVKNASTGGMLGDYASGVICSAASDSPDAVYRLRPSANTGLKFSVTGSGLGTPVIGLFDGPPMTTPVPHDLGTDGNLNEGAGSAEFVSFGSSTHRYDGNTSAMSSDTDVSLAACGSSPIGNDAAFRFTLTEATAVELDASASPLAKPVLRLFEDGPVTRPVAVPLVNDDRAVADANPATTPDIAGSWLNYSGDMAGLSSESQTQLAVAGSNDDSASPSPVPQDLGDISGTRAAVGGANTAAMQADYPGVCGAADGGKDAVYTFRSATATTVHVKAVPAAGYDLVLGLYRGTNGPPLRLLDQSSVTEDLACADRPGAAPRNLTRATLSAMDADVASAVDVDLGCATTPTLNTTDPDGAGAAIANFSGWCGPQPTAYVQPQLGGPDAVVLLMRSLRIPVGTTLRATGDRPLILVVTEDAAIDGVLDINGSFGVAGAGGGVSCGASGGGDAVSAGGYSGGGGGGGFATSGGDGGVGTNGSRAGGTRGAARGNVALVPLLAGCNGGHSDGAYNVGAAGGGVQVSVLGTLSLGGSILANGAIGITPGLTNLGGSGGGSGGAISIEADKLSYSPTSLRVDGGAGALGGGGGLPVTSGGAGSMSGGTPGANGTGSTSATRSGAGGGGGFGRLRAEERPMSLTPCGPGGHEDVASAWPLDVDDSGKQSIEVGDTTAMRHDHDVTRCGAASDAPDAVYAFTLGDKSDIRIDARNSPDETVIAIFDAGGLTSGGDPLGCITRNEGLDVTTTLSPGDYRIVVTRTTIGGGAFDVRVRNATYAAAAAVEVACDAAGQQLTAAIDANTPYYLVVKGANAAESGAYGLTIETPGTGPSMGCSASPGAADAIYKFHVPSPRAVSIDTEGSAVDTVLALYPASATEFGTSYATDAGGVIVDCDDDGGFGPGASRIDAALAADDYYVVVKRKTVSWSIAPQPFRLAIRDGDATSPLACASATIGAKKILQTLAPGDYHVVVSGETVAGGAYAVKFRDVTHFGLENGVQLTCTSGSGTLTHPNFEMGKDYYVVVKGNAANESGGYELTVEDTVSLSAAAGSTAVACAAEGSQIDGVYPAGTYYALVSGPAAESGPYTLRVQDLDAKNDQNRIACDDDSGPNRTSAIEADLAAGTHYVVVKGKSAADRGGYRVHVRDVQGVPDRRLACANGTTGSARIEYDVRAGRDYTLLLKGSADGGEGDFALNLFDSVSSPSAMGSMLECKSDPQPTPLKNSTWDRRTLELTRTLDPATYYVAVKGVRQTDAGYYQLQIGQQNAATTHTYQAPTWATTRDALVASGVRVLPVIATQGETSNFVQAAEAQAQLLAAASGAVRADGTPIWQKINKNGTGTGTALVSSIADLASHLAMDVSLHAVDGPDPGASRFKVDITPQNSPSCQNPHPLVDAAGACSGVSATYNCNTQYKCRPGAAPKFRVTFTNPVSAPVPPNDNNQYGGYLFKLQLKGDGKYLLEEIPVFIIPTTRMVPPPVGTYRSEGTYEQNVDATSCKMRRNPVTGEFELSASSTDLPSWLDLYFKADIPEGAAIDFELCARDVEDDLKNCDWSDQTGSKRTKVTVTSQGDCSDDSECLSVPGKGNGFCSDYGTCQFISPQKVDWDQQCGGSIVCPNGPFGAGDYVVSSHCERTAGQYGYGHCVYHSAPIDIGAALAPNEDGKLFSRVQIKLRGNAAGNATPTLYEWYMTYRCEAAL